MRTRNGVIALCVALALSGLCIAGCSSTTNSGDATSMSAQQTQKSAAFSLEGEIEPTTMLDNDLLTVAANSLTYKNNVAYLNVSLTNKTSGALDATACTLGFSGNCVNDCMVDEGYLGGEIAPGETVEEEVKFNISSLQLYGIQQIESIGLGLRVVDDDYNEVFKDIIEVKTSLADDNASAGSLQSGIGNTALQQTLNYNAQTATVSADELSQSGVEALSTTLLRNKDGKAMVMVELQNNTSSTVNVKSSNITIDGSMAYEGVWNSSTVAPGKRVVLDFTLNNAIGDDQADSFDLDNMSNMGFALTVNDANYNTILPPTNVEISF